MSTQERQRPLRRGDELVEEAKELLSLPKSQVRCPYCKEELVLGELAGACNECNTLHHLGCFSEHRGCSTHACGGTRATSLRLGSTNSPSMPLHTCGVCKGAIWADAMVARCRGSHLQHVECYERTGACLVTHCKKQIEIMACGPAVVENYLKEARLAFVFGAVCLTASLVAGVTAIATRGDTQIFSTMISALSGLVLLAMIALGVHYNSGAMRAAKTVARFRANSKPGAGSPDPSRTEKSA